MGCWIWGLDFMVIRSDMIYLTVEPWSLFFTSGTTIPQNHKSFQVGDLLWLLQLHSTATVQPEKDNPGNHEKPMENLHILVCNIRISKYLYNLCWSVWISPRTLLCDRADTNGDMMRMNGWRPPIIRICLSHVSVEVPHSLPDWEGTENWTKSPRAWCQSATINLRIDLTTLGGFVGFFRKAVEMSNLCARSLASVCHSLSYFRKMFLMPKNI